MAFLNEGESIPSSSGNYAKLQDGDNRFRIISKKPVTGYCAWMDKKKIHKKTSEDFEGLDLDTPKFGEAIKYFWAVVVWNYEEDRVQILELTQKQIMFGLEQLSENEKFGKDLTNHDVNIIRGESNGKVVYSVLGEPPIGEPSPAIQQKIKESGVDLDRLFTGENPFGTI